MKNARFSVAELLQLRAQEKARKAKARQRRAMRQFRIRSLLALTVLAAFAFVTAPVVYPRALRFPSRVKQLYQDWKELQEIERMKGVPMTPDVFR